MNQGTRWVLLMQKKSPEKILCLSTFKWLLLCRSCSPIGYSFDFSTITQCVRYYSTIVQYSGTINVRVAIFLSVFVQLYFSFVNRIIAALLCSSALFSPLQLFIFLTLLSYFKGPGLTLKRSRGVFKKMLHPCFIYRNKSSSIGQAKVS